MGKTSKSLAIFAILLALSAVEAKSAKAFLGADEGALPIVSQTLAARSEKTTTHSSHTVHEYAVARGTIKAYVSNEGQIFAYVGHKQMGFAPSSLFGPYLGEYQAAVKQFHLKGGRRPLQINTAHIRAGIKGPQGSLEWYVILQNLPAGVSANDIH